LSKNSQSDKVCDKGCDEAFMPTSFSDELQKQAVLGAVHSRHPKRAGGGVNRALQRAHLRFFRGTDPGRIQLAPAGVILSRRDKTLRPAAWLQLCAAVLRSEAGPERRLQSA
jgi:hypothetical protein